MASSARQIQKAKAGVEDLLLGDSPATVTQTRNGAEYSITKINADKIPYSGNLGDVGTVTVKDKFDANDILIASNTNIIAKKTVDTIADLIAVTSAERTIALYVNVGGFYSAGDGGGLFKWNSAGLESTHNGITIISPQRSGTPGDSTWWTAPTTGTDGVWERVYLGPMDARVSGAKGDDSTDDTVPIQALIDIGEYFEFIDGIFLVKDLDFDQGVKEYVGRNASLKLYSENGRIGFVQASSVRFRDLVFSGGDLYVQQALMRVDEELTGIEFNNCVFQNVKAPSDIPDLGGSNSAQYGLMIGMSATECTVKGCIFKDISSYNNLGTATSAFAGGIVVFNWSASAVEKCYVDISDCVFDNIWTDNIAADIDKSDADGIRVWTGESTVVELDININNVSFYGVQKSAIKVSGSSGLKISGVYVDALRTDVPMIAAVRLQQSDNTSLSDVTVKGSLYRILLIKSNNVTVDGLYYTEDANAYASTTLVQINSISAVAGSLANTVIRNVRADNIKIAFYIRDEHTSGGVEFCKTMKLTNWDVSPASGVSEFFQINNVNQCILNNVHVDFTGIGKITTCVAATYTSDLTIMNSSFYANSYGLRLTGTSDGLRLINNAFYRANSATSLSTRFLNLYTLSDDVKIEGLRVSVPTYDSSTTTETILISGTNISMSDVEITIRNAGGGSNPIAHLAIAAASDVSLKGIKLFNYHADVATCLVRLTSVTRLSGVGITANTVDGVKFNTACNDIILDDVSGVPAISDLLRLNSVTGYNTSVVTNQLVDSAADFVTDGVAAGMQVVNITNGTYAFVKARVDLNTLTLETAAPADIDLFKAAGNRYAIYDSVTNLTLGTTHDFVT